VGINLAAKRPRVARLALVLLAIAAAALSGASAAPAEGNGPAAHASRGSRAFVKTYKVVPKVQRTVRSTGYATYVFKAPVGHRILGANARIVGAQRHAVAITGRSIASQLTRYTVKLVFPGEQGKPGKLVGKLVVKLVLA
jgi:hypothetical protein